MAFELREERVIIELSVSEARAFLEGAAGDGGERVLADVEDGVRVVESDSESVYGLKKDDVILAAPGQAPHGEGAYGRAALLALLLPRSPEGGSGGRRRREGEGGGHRLGPAAARA